MNTQSPIYNGQPYGPPELLTSLQDVAVAISQIPAGENAERLGALVNGAAQVLLELQETGRSTRFEEEERQRLNGTPAVCTAEMLDAAMRSAFSTGLLPRDVESDVERAQFWTAMKCAIESALDTARGNTVPAAAPLGVPAYLDKFAIGSNVAQDIAPYSSAEIEVLHLLTFRTLWLAYCWNDHNFDSCLTEAMKACNRFAIDTPDKAAEWIAKFEQARHIEGITPENATILRKLASRLISIAFFTVEEHRDDSYLSARQACQSLGLKSFDDCNNWLAKVEDALTSLYRREAA